MAITRRADAQRALNRPGRFLYLTHGEGYAVGPEPMPVARKLAGELTGDLFANCGTDMPLQRRGSGAETLIANEDGLFPGFSQTWRMES